MKNKWMLVGCMLALPLTAFAGKGGREGHGGDFYIGSDFYTIGARLENEIEVAPYQIGALLDEGLSIIPSDSPLTTLDASGKIVYVDALSEVIGGKSQTKVMRNVWGQLSCEKKYHLVLHELFVLKSIENSLSYNVSSPIMEILSKRGLDCSRIGEDAERIRVEKILNEFSNIYRAVIKDNSFKIDRSALMIGIQSQALTERRGIGKLSRFMNEVVQEVEKSKYVDELLACVNVNAGLYFDPITLGEAHLFTRSLLDFAHSVEKDCYSERGLVTPYRIMKVQITRAVRDYLDLDSSLSDFYHSKTLRRHGVRINDDLKAANALAQLILERTYGKCDLTGVELQKALSKDKADRYTTELGIVEIAEACTNKNK